MSKMDHTDCYICFSNYLVDFVGWLLTYQIFHRMQRQMFPLLMSQYCFLKFCFRSFSRSFFVDICFRFLFEGNVTFSGKVLPSKLVPGTIIKRKEKRWGRFTVYSLTTGVLNTTIQFIPWKSNHLFSIDWFYKPPFYKSSQRNHHLFNGGWHHEGCSPAKKKTVTTRIVTFLADCGSC